MSRATAALFLDPSADSLFYCQQVMHLFVANTIRPAVASEVVSIPAIRISGHNRRAGKRA
jgi:hypothetical protein